MEHDSPEQCFELGFVQRSQGEHFIDSSFLWLFASEACGDVNGTNVGHAIEKQTGLLGCQDAGEREQAGVREAKERRIEVTVDNGCYGAMIVAGELVKGEAEILELDSRSYAFLQRCCQNYDVIQL